MTDTVRTIRLYGPLGARFGRIHRLAVLSAREAGHALAQIVPGFAQYLIDSADRGIRYAVFLGRRNIGEDLLDLPAGGDEIRIAPIVHGAKSGLFQTILGAALIAFAFWNPAGLAATPLIEATAATGAITIGGVALAVGAALALGGYPR